MIGINLWGIFLMIGLMFGFYISGTGIKSLLNLKNENPFSAIVIGLFTFFAFMTIVLLPFQIFSLFLRDYIYIYFAFSILYFLMFIVIFKFWVNTTVFSMKFVQYIIAFFAIMGIVYVCQKYVLNTEKSTYSLEENVKYFHDLINNKKAIADIAKEKGDDWSAFYILFYSIDFVFGNNTAGFEQFVNPFILIFSSCLLSSIFITIYSFFNQQTTQIGRWVLFFLSLMVFFLLIAALAYFDISIYRSDYYFVLLVTFVSILVIQNGSNHYSEENQPVLIGMILGSYMAFSFKNTYPVLFLIYAFIFVTQLTQPTGYFKGISKMSSIILIQFAIYNIYSKLWVQAIIFIGLVFVFFLIAFKSRSKYFLETNFELYLKERNVVALLLVPISFFIVSVAYELSKNMPIFSSDVNYLKTIFWWFDQIKEDTFKDVTVFLIMMGLLVFSIIWIFIRQKFKNYFTLLALDIFLILYLTFYNPLFTRIITIIAPDLNLTSGYSLIAIMMTFIILIPFDISNLIQNKKNKNEKLVVNYKPNRLYI